MIYFESEAPDILKATFDKVEKLCGLRQVFPFALSAPVVCRAAIENRGHYTRIRISTLDLSAPNTATLVIHPGAVPM